MEVEAVATDDLSKGKDVMMKRRGPSTEPWGTPWVTGEVEDLQLFMEMN